MEKESPLHAPDAIVGFSSLSKEDQRALTDEEVKQAMFEMAPYKAPGSDGLHAGFFQSTWDIMSKTLCQLITNFFQTELLRPSLVTLF